MLFFPVTLAVADGAWNLPNSFRCWLRCLLIEKHPIRSKNYLPGAGVFSCEISSLYQALEFQGCFEGRLENWFHQVKGLNGVVRHHLPRVEKHYNSSRGWASDSQCNYSRGQCQIKLFGCRYWQPPLASVYSAICGVFCRTSAAYLEL